MNLLNTRIPPKEANRLQALMCIRWLDEHWNEIKRAGIEPVTHKERMYAERIR
jgi:hypothetical protein